MRHLGPLLLGVALLLPACGQRQVFTPVDETTAGSSDELGDESPTSKSAASESEDTGTPPDMGKACEPPPPPPDDIPTPPPGCEHVYLWGCETYELTDTPSGWYACGESKYAREFYRHEPVACLYDYGREACDQADGACQSDADCGTGEACSKYYDGCYCLPAPCMSDADCDPGFSCLCASGLDGQTLNWNNMCVPSDCNADADCGPEPMSCRLGRDLCGGPSNANCSTPADDCKVDADCPNEWCRWDEADMLWTCDSPAICE